MRLPVPYVGAAARWVGVAVLIGIVVGALVLLVVYVPQVAISSQGLTRTQWLSAIQELRVAVLQGLGGLALLGTLYFSARTLQLNRRGQVTDRFTRAIEQLASEKLDIRVGGIYALEQIAHDSKDLHPPIIEILAAFLREKSLEPPQAPATPAAAASGASIAADANTTETALRADFQAICRVLGRRKVKFDPGGQFEVNLYGATLNRADFAGAQLQRVNFTRCQLRNAIFDGAQLQRATFIATRLKEAHLWHTDLRGAVFSQADLDQANFEDADLAGARFAVDSSMPKYDAKGLTRKQLGEAKNVDKAVLPKYLFGFLQRDKP